MKKKEKGEGHDYIHKRTAGRELSLVGDAQNHIRTCGDPNVLPRARLLALTQIRRCRGKM